MGVILHLKTQNLLRKADSLEETLFTSAKPSVGLLKERLSAGEAIIPVLCIHGANTSIHNTLTPEGKLKMSPSNNHILTAYIDNYLSSAQAVEHFVPIVFLVKEGLHWGHVRLLGRADGAWLLQLMALTPKAQLFSLREETCLMLAAQGSALINFSKTLNAMSAF